MLKQSDDSQINGCTCCKLEHDFECMMISKSIHIEQMKCVVGLMRFDVFSIDVVGGVGGDEMSCMVDSVNVDDGNVWAVAHAVAWMDDPHPCIRVRTVPYMGKPLYNGTRINFAHIVE